MAMALFSKKSETVNETNSSSASSSSTPVINQTMASAVPVINSAPAPVVMAALRKLAAGDFSESGLASDSELAGLVEQVRLRCGESASKTSTLVDT